MNTIKTIKTMTPMVLALVVFACSSSGDPDAAGEAPAAEAGAPPATGTPTGSPSPNGPTTTQGDAAPPGADASAKATNSGGEDFKTRCANASVVKCVSFDTATDVAGKWGDNHGTTSGATTPEHDPSMGASGGSIKFTIPSNTAADTSGSWFTNFSDDLSVQFGENSELYVQWRQRFSADFVSTYYLGDSGIKQAIITAGDQPGKTYASCETIGIVTSTYGQQRFPILYDSCTGSASHGPYDGFYEPFKGPNGDDFKLQNARPAPYCLYSGKTTGYFAPGGNCFGWAADEWMTFQIGIQTGPRVGDELASSHVKLWIAREGKPSELVIDWGPYNLSVGSAAENQRFGKVWLLPYQTSKDASQTHPTAYTWYDELVVSRAKISDPI